MTCEIDIAGLVKRFGTNTVLDGIDLCLKPGERVAIIGPSGTGKSTLITSLIKETFVEDVQEIVPELTLPADVSPEGVTTKIVDTYRTLRPR